MKSQIENISKENNSENCILNKNFDKSNNLYFNENSMMTTNNSTKFNQIEQNLKNIKINKDKSQISKHIKNENFIIYTDNEKEKISISIDLINNLFNSDEKSKVFYLICDTLKTEQLLNNLKIIENLNDKIYYFQGKRGKKQKNNIDSFNEIINKYKLFICLPDVLYKLLSIGFIKIFDINMIIFNDCNFCESLHPYNLIMNEFYFYYLKCNVEIKEFLPKIYGFTSNPFKNKAINIKNNLINLCENLDCNFLIDKDLIDNNEKINNFEENNFIEISHLDDKKHIQNFNYLNEILKEDFFKLLLKCYIKNLDENKLPKNFEDVYMNFINEKFKSRDFNEYNNVLTNSKFQEMFNIISDDKNFKFFEKIQRQIFMIIENIELPSIIELLENYKKNFKTDEKNKFEIINIYDNILNKIQNSIKKKHLIYISFKFKYLLQKLSEITKTNKKKTIIFVYNRIVAKYIEKYLTKKKLKCLCIIGLNKKKNISNVLSPVMQYSEFLNILSLYNSNDINILISTNSLEDGIDINECNNLIVYTDLYNNKNYFKMKKFCCEKKSNFLFFTNDKKNKINKLNEYLKLKNNISTYFKNNNIVDFRRINYYEEKEFKNMFFIKETHAKLTIRNANSILIDILSKIKSKDNNKINFKKDFHNNKGQFKCLLEISADKHFNGMLITSGEYNDKQSAENDCYFQFIIYLYKHNFIDNHFKYKNDN